MTTYNNSLVVYVEGRLQKLQSDDTVGISGSVNIGGDLNVQGDIVSTGATNVLVNDAFLDLSSGYTNTATARAGGFTVNVKATDFSTETGTDFVPGVVATSAPRIVVADPTAFSAGDIIQVSGATVAGNNGLFIVAAVSGTDIDLYGVGSTAVPGYALFCQNQLTASTGDTATLTKVDLAVVTVSDGVNIKDSSGTPIPVGALTTAYYAGATVSNFNGTGPGTGYDNATTVTLQDAYDASGTPATITLAGGKDFLIAAPGSGTAGFSLNAKGAASDLTVDSANLYLQTTTSGGVSIDSASAFSINSTANNGTISAGGNSLITELTGSSAGAKDLSIRALNSGAGTGNISARAKTNAKLQADPSSETGTVRFEADFPSKTATVEVNDSAGIINIGAGISDGTINVGTNGAKVIAVGSASAGAVTVDSGSGVSIDASAASNFTVDSADLTLSTFNSGTVFLTSAGALTLSGVGAVGINSSTGNINIGQQANSGDVNVGTGGPRTINVGGASAVAVNVDAGAVSIDGTQASNFSVTGNDLTLSTVTSGALDVTSAGILDIDAANALSINSSGGVINVGDDAVNNAINIGTGGDRTITIGNTTGATAIVADAGTGGVDVNSGGNVTIDGTGISLDGTAASNFTVDSADLTLSTFNSGTVFLTSAGAMNIDAVGAMSLNTTGGAINIGDQADVNPINIGTGAAARDITVGNSTSTTSVDVTAGTGGIALQATNGNITATALTSGSVTLSAPAGGGSFTVDGNLSLTSNGSTASLTGQVVTITSNAAGVTISGNEGVVITAPAQEEIKVGTPTAPMSFGVSSASQSAGGTFLPVGASSGISIGEVLYMNTSGELAKADGDGTGTREVIGVALTTALVTAGDLIVGTVLGSVIPVKFASAPTGSDLGKPVYLSTTAGQATMTAPVSGRVYRLGLLLSSTANGLGNYRVLWQPNLVADL